MEGNAQSYVVGFVQGLIACEMIVLLIKITIDMIKNHQDMKKFDEIHNRLGEDICWSKAVTEAYVKTNKRLDKIVEKLDIEEDKEDE